MNRLRVIGLIAIAVLAAWIGLRSCAPEVPPPAPAPIPQREAFHVLKPLRVVVESPQATDVTWLERELRYLLTRGKMRIAPPSPVGSNAPATPFTLRLTPSAADGHANVALIAPDGVIEKQEDFALTRASKLETMQALSQHLPAFLGAPDATTDWSAALGTANSEAYDIYLQASDELFARGGEGFTSPPQSAPNVVANVERLEKLARGERGFTRARALLSIAYLSIGGEDRTSLAKLAETAAERALTADTQLAEAHAALGIVRWQRSDWTAAQEHFDAALALDPSSVPALEGLACLHMDVGHATAALPIALLAKSLQPGNRGARTCAAYALAATGGTEAPTDDDALDIVRIRTAMLMLAGDHAGAAMLLSALPSRASGLMQAVLAASESKAHIPAALREITRAVDDEEIDAETEVLLGTALRQADFVFNRMLRLAKQNEALPARLLWLPQTEFLRRHRRFKEVIAAATLAPYWQDHTPPDVCATEPKVYGCAQQTKR